MSFDYLRSAFAVCKCRVSDPLAFTLLLSLANCAGKDGNTKTYAKLCGLAATCRIDERSARRKLRLLEEGGLVKVSIGGGRQTSRYQLIDKALTTHIDGSAMDKPCPRELVGSQPIEPGPMAPAARTNGPRMPKFSRTNGPRSPDNSPPQPGLMAPAARTNGPLVYNVLPVSLPVSLPVFDRLQGSARSASPEPDSFALGSSPQTPPVFALSVVEPQTTKPARQPKPIPQTDATWEAYSAAYERRYGAAPNRNGKVNGQLAKFVQQWGAAAPAIAEFYLTHPRAFYVQRCHPIDLLLLDGQALKTQLDTGRIITADSARGAERTASSAAVWMSLAYEDRE